MPVETERGYKVTLSFGQRRVLLMLSQRSRRVVMSTAQFTEATRQGLEGLDKLGLMTTTPLIGRDASEFMLTDLGAQVVDQMRATLKAEIEAANRDENYQAMMTGFSGSRDCPHCTCPFELTDGKFPTHPAVLKGGMVIECPGSGKMI